MEIHKSELESFRQQWKAEVSAKAKSQEPPRSDVISTSKTIAVPQPYPQILKESRLLSKTHLESNENTVPKSSVQQLKDIPPGDGEHVEPQTALEHYERAVEREIDGNLGESLAHYRKAFHLDSCVDQLYKHKHFPAASAGSKPTNPDTSGTSVAIPNPAHHSLDGPPPDLKELINSFSELRIEPAPAAIEGTLPPPCPLSHLPHEIILQILMETAVMDVAAYVRLAQVCKRLAYLVISEDQIWRRICLESKVGFGSMHYQWNVSMFEETTDNYYGTSIAAISNLVPQDPESHTRGLLFLDSGISKAYITDILLQNLYGNSFLKMFRDRPRIRFNGCYISTVNYMRPGQASVSQVSWNSPVHIVTYYRYLRFFRDGSVVSLLTTTEPLEVVYQLTKENVRLHKGGAAPHLPSSVMRNALLGRWHLSSLSDRIQSIETLSNMDLNQAEEDVFIETEGAGPKNRYKYHMTLGLKTAGKAGPRNNKLVWKGYWNYNRLTDDWAQFGLKNDKAFFWSRVKSFENGV